jgi:hypothetical protein
MAQNLLPEMIGVSNNSRLTNTVEISLVNKLSPKELEDFRQWLKLVKDKQELIKGNRFKF